MRHLKKAASCALFLAILIASLLLINGALEGKYTLQNSKWPTTSTYRQFYDMERDSVDALFLGSSLVVNAFIPQEIYNDYGICSYNLASEQQSIFLSYFWLREALRFQKPAVVVVDTKFLWNVHPEDVINTSEALTRKCLDAMRWSPVKREAVHTLCALDDSQSELSYYLTNIRYHARWTELSERDLRPAMTAHAELKGYGPLSEITDEVFVPFESADTAVTTELMPLMQEYMDKIAALCQENDIRLVLVSLPGNDMSDAAHNTYTQLAERYGADYYNLCEKSLYEQIGIVPPESILWHSNIWGAEKLSRFVGGILHDSFGLGGRTDEQYESTRSAYAHVQHSADLTLITDPTEYLLALDEPGYAVFFAAHGFEAGPVLTKEENLAALRALGLSCAFQEHPADSYAAAVIDGVVDAEESSPWAIHLVGSLRGRRSVYMLDSRGVGLAAGSGIMIDGEQCNNVIAGLNIAVYDLFTEKLIDKVTLYSGRLYR